MALATPKDVNTYMRGDVQRASGKCKGCLRGYDCIEDTR